MNTQAVQQSTDAGQARAAGGVTGVPLAEQSLLVHVLGIIKMYNMSAVMLDKHLPRKAVCRQSTAFRVLCVVFGNPMCTKAQVRRYRISSRSVERCLDYLMSLGYVKAVKKPRLIIPFQAYKIDIGYRVTVKGEIVLKALMGM